jgi:nucleotide-binding universal stress UspA family protein
MKNILVPTDFSESATAALEQAAQLARLTGGRVTLLHVLFLEKIRENLLGLDALEHLARAVDMPSDAEAYSSSSTSWRLRDAAQQKLSEAVAAIPAPPAIETAIAEGRPSVEIVAYAAEHAVDLIVMGTHGRGTLGRAFLGSVADNVIRQAACPVMVVRR